jgi:protein involved in polysaccharide export with SLBB domain
MSQDTMSQDTVLRTRVGSLASVGCSRVDCLGRRSPGCERRASGRDAGATRLAGGTITLPHIGTIEVSNDRTQLRERLRAAAQRDAAAIRSEPVRSGARASRCPSGAVAQPGLYGLSRQTKTVADLISQAGG